MYMKRRQTARKMRRSTRRNVTRRRNRSYKGGRGYTTGATAELMQSSPAPYARGGGCGCGMRLPY